MTNEEMIKLQNEFGSELKIENAIHLHDEYEWNKLTISYKGIIVGSELVDYEFARNNILKVK